MSCYKGAGTLVIKASKIAITCNLHVYDPFPASGLEIRLSLTPEPGGTVSSRGQAGWAEGGSTNVQAESHHPLLPHLSLSERLLIWEHTLKSYLS